MFYIENINDRIKVILDVTGMTKTDFGKKLNVSQAYISKLVKTGTPSPRLVEDICEKIGINKDWLISGVGDMFRSLPLENEVAAAISNVLEDMDCENSIYTLVKEALLKYERLDSKSKKVLENYVDDVINGLAERREEN